MRHPAAALLASVSLLSTAVLNVTAYAHPPATKTHASEKERRSFAFIFGGVGAIRIDGPQGEILNWGRNVPDSLRMYARPVTSVRIDPSLTLGPPYYLDLEISDPPDTTYIVRLNQGDASYRFDEQSWCGPGGIRGNGDFREGYTECLKLRFWRTPEGDSCLVSLTPSKSERLSKSQ